MRITGDVVENISKGKIILVPPDIPHCWSFDKKVHDTEGKIENICPFINPHFFENF